MPVPTCHRSYAYPYTMSYIKLGPLKPRTKYTYKVKSGADQVIARVPIRQSDIPALTPQSQTSATPKGCVERHVRVHLAVLGWRDAPCDLRRYGTQVRTWDS